jgi:hypothetical protein
LKRLVTLLTSAALLVLVVGVAPAVAQPVLVSPTNGQSFPRNASINFTVDLPVGGDIGSIALSTSAATNADGTLASPLSSFDGTTIGSPGTYTWLPTDQAVGTYYWQATSFVCEDAAPYTCGYQDSPVQSLVLTALPAPAPVSPASGATLIDKKSASVSFNPNQQDDDTKLFVIFSRSNAIGSDGVLSNPAKMTADLTDDEGVADTNVSTGIPAAIDTPGTLYWQPIRVNCNDNPTAPCNVAGAVSELKLKDPPLRVRITGPTTIHIGLPKVTFATSCNDACSGTIRVRAAVQHGNSFTTDAAFSPAPTKFTLRANRPQAWGYRYSGKMLAKLASAVKADGSVRLTVTVSAKSDGGSATATHTLFVRPNPPPPPPPGPDAGLSFSGNGEQNLGPITVPVNSYLVWSCSGCDGQFGLASGLDGALSNISVESSAGSGTDYVDAGTYPDVQVFTTGDWAISFVRAN